MKRIVYVGHKVFKADNVAQTGLTWTRGEIHEIQDDKKAEKLLEHSHVWADADKPFEMQPLVEPVLKAPPPPAVSFIPQGGSEVPYAWDPITVPVTAEVFKKLMDKVLIPVFISAEDADLFDKYRKQRERQLAGMAAAREAKKQKHAA